MDGASGPPNAPNAPNAPGDHSGHNDPNHPMHVPPCLLVALGALLLGVLLGIALTMALCAGRRPRARGVEAGETTTPPSTPRAASAPVTPPRVFGNVTLRLVNKGE